MHLPQRFAEQCCRSSAQDGVNPDVLEMMKSGSYFFKHDFGRNKRSRKHMKLSGDGLSLKWKAVGANETVAADTPGASSGGTSTTVNHLSAGRIPGGATVERAVPTPLGQGGFIHLESMVSDFTTVARVVQTINRTFGEGVASAVDGRQVRVAAPTDSTQRVLFMSQLENLPITSGEAAPKVVMNARTGSVVMNQLVTLAPCAVSHGNLTVSVQTQPLVSQPGAFSGGQTAVTEQARVEIKSDQGKVISMPAAPSLNDVVRALNAVGATPQDLLGILQAMKSAGALRAELEII
jgi:flagellar P-ring protein precursor FlgI